MTSPNSSERDGDVSETAARAFLDRVSDDETLAAELDALRTDLDAVLARVHAEGFDATQEEIRHAFLERFGAELSPEELDSVAAGISNDDGIRLGAVALGATSVIGAAAALLAAA